MRAIKKILMALILFLILYWTLSYLSRPTGHVLDKNWSLTIGSSTKKIELPYYQFSEESGLATFRTSFRLTDGDILIIPKISCYSYKVYINGFMVSQVGDFDNPTANIWNYAHVIGIDRNILKKNNELVIQVYALDDIGMHIPPFIDKKENIMQRISIFNFINNDIHLIMLGSSMAIALIMAAISIPSKSNKVMYLYLGLSTIFGALYSFDCLYRITSGDINTFLTIRKILFSSVYIAGVFLVLGIEKYTEKTSKMRNLTLVIVGAAVLLVAMSKDFIELRSRINTLNIVMLISPIYVVFLIFRHKKFQFYFSTSFVTLTIVYTVLSIAFKAHAPYLFPYGIIIFSLGLSISIILEFTNIYVEKDRIYMKAVTDHLTKAYNRNILEEINMDLNDILILIDVDNLKYYNDTFGHRRGDILLIEIVNIIRSYIRKDDFIIRLGGDEFLIILKNADEVVAKKIISRIRTEFKNQFDNEKVDISFGILRYQADFEKSYNQVDKMMYKMKLNKKDNRVEI